MLLKDQLGGSDKNDISFLLRMLCEAANIA